MPLSKLEYWAKRLYQSRNWRIFFTVILLLMVLDIAFPVKVNPQYSTVITDSDDKILHAFLNPHDKWRMQTELKEITPTLEKAIIFKEDRWFRYHFGINPIAVGRAFFNNIIKRRRTSGASTITMQVVRLLYPQERTYWHKITEMIRAIQLELHYSKDEILQMYLSLVPYGSNIEGLKSASVLYFQKSPDVLSLAEVTALTIIPNRPSSLRLGKNNTYILQERNKWLQRFAEAGLFASQDIEDALAEPLQVRRHEAPKLAPHLAYRLKTTYPNEPTIHSSLHRNLQLTLEKIVQNYVNRLYGINIHNAAVLLINNQTKQVEAYVGSADFNNPIDGGQVDGIRAIRSPGSTLKPLLYGIAFDKGIITPKSAINDVPSNFGGFEPENFDKQFHGKVTAEFALANSLNIPAVKLLKDISTASMIEKLKKAEFQTIKKSASKLGLSLALGGCGVTLEELTNLFSSFAHQGTFTKATLLAEENPNKPTEILSEDATFLINQILSQITRPDLPNNYEYTYRMPKIAWKTGTSFGKKDAWSIGYNAKYTLGIWIGNFSGEGVPELSGANIATPLLLDIFNTIDYNSSAKWFSPSANLAMRKVCAETGAIPSEHCNHQITDYYIMGVSNTQSCTHTKAVWVNPSATISYCAVCMPDSGMVQKQYPVFAPELIAWYQTRHIQYGQIPPHNPQCTRVFNNNAPIISSPNDGAEYWIEPNEAVKLQLSCQVGNDVKMIYWYINDKLYQKSAPQQETFFYPEAGNIKISCTDDKGRTSHIYIQVKRN